MEGESEKQKPSAMVAQFQKNWELHVPQTHILGRSILNMLKTPLAEGIEIDNGNGAANGRPQSSIFFQSAKKRVTNGADQGKLLLDVQELEDACKASMEAVLHMDGAEHIREEMKAYTNEVFERLDKTREPLWQAAKQKLEQRQDLRLSCTVVSAQGIPAMDANGKSDPYCSLGVLPRRHQESQVQKGGNLEDWKEKLLGQVKKTSVKMATLEPEWNETLEFPLIDPMEEVLVIEVWDSDETAVGVTKVKGLKGIGNFLHDLRKGDDFIGRAFYSLSGLPIQPERRTLPIFSQSKKQQQQGSITVTLSLKGREEVASPSDRLHNHKLLLKSLIAHESQQAAKRAGSDGYMTPWDAQLSSSAESLLALHAKLGDIEDYHQAAIRVSALMDYHKAYCLTPQALLTLIHLIETHSILLPKAEAKSYSQDGGGSPTNVRKQSSASRSSGEQKWSAKAFHDLRNALTDAIEVLHNHLSLLDDSSEGVLEQIREALVLVKRLYQFEEFVARLPADHKPVKTVVEKAVEVAVSEWHHSNGNSAPSDQQGSEDRLVVMKNITSHCLQLLSRIQVTVVPIFQELLEVDYLAHFIVALDELLQDKVLSWLKFPLTGFREKDEEILSMSFEVYLMFQDMAKVAKKIDLRVGSSLQLPSSHSWFVHLVPEWLRIALVRCKDGISRAVEFDGVVNSKKDVCFSSSLVETMTYLQQMVEFWKELNWPFPIDACGFMITLVKNISDAAMYYVEEVFARNRDSSECAKMSGGAADQLCLILNDMQHIQTTLSPPQLEGGGGASGGCDGGGGGGVKVTSIFEELQLEGFFSWIETEKGLGQRARSQVRDTVESTVLAIQNKIHVATEKLAQQLPTVAKFVNKMLDAEESVSPETAVHPLADYLTANLQLLSSRLLYIVFWQLLRQLWSTVVTVLCNKTCSLASSSESHVYQRMQHAALVLRDIFHAGGEGLSVAELESQQYKALLGDLELMCLSPPELVLKCCEDLVEQQAMATSLTEHRLGELALSIRYLRDKGTLEVTIVLAQNLPGLNKNGFSDPYVELMLMPATYFEGVNRGVKTRVQRRNLNPVFNQTLSLPAREELLGKAGIILVLCVYDYDMIGENGLMGLCVLPCSDVPLVGVASGTQEGSEQPLGQPKSFLLPLFHVSESKVFQKLALRSEHSYHQEPLEFLKLLNKKCRPRSSPHLMSRLGAMTFTRHVS